MKHVAPIRLFVDAHVFDGPHQGTRSFIQGLYSRVRNEAGIKLFLAARDTEKLAAYFEPDENTILLRYTSKSRYRRLLFEIPRMLRKHSIDYAHFQYITPLSKPCFFIVTTHDVLFCDLPADFSVAMKMVKKWLYKKAAHHADLLTTVSDHARGSIRKHLGVPFHKIALVPNGVDRHDHRPSQQEAAREIRSRYGIEKFVLLVSRIEPRKNHELLVRLFTRLQLADRGFHLVFIGRKTQDTPALEAALAALPQAEREKIVFIDQLDTPTLQQFYCAATVFAFPSRGEGFGIPPLEAAAAGTPVICSRAAALESFDFFGDDHIDPKDERAFESRLSYHINGPRNNDLLHARAETVRQRYCWGASARSFVQLIRDHHQNQAT
ncbi:MAG: glycosyltransferase family 4 protein [Flaviaesturariibacter sp.]|nr:glycosyltransferase family 4 protein [Flaviaesturariibacter sp.]